MYHAAGTKTTNNTGCALLIPPNMPKAHDEKVVYSRADGKALGVHMTWMGRKLRRPEVDGVLGERECIWMSDDTYVDDRARDVVPVGQPCTRRRRACCTPKPKAQESGR